MGVLRETEIEMTSHEQCAGMWPKHLICIDHTADVTVSYAAAPLKVYKTTELRGPQQNQALVCLDGKVSNVFRNALCKIAV